MSRVPAVRASKLEPRRPSADALQRERLLARLAGADTPIVLIAASAGYGKSTLAAQWSTRCQRPVAWLNLDRADNDPIVFLNAVAHALDRLDPVAPELLDELTALMPRVIEVILPGLAVELDRLSPVELILDDVQELTQPQCLAALNFLLEEVPSESQVVLVTRAHPELPLARRRVAGELLEIRADELALDADETLALAESSGSHLSEQALRSATRTNGGMACRGRPRPARAPRAGLRRRHRKDDQRNPARDSRLRLRSAPSPGDGRAPPLPARNLGSDKDDGLALRHGPGR